jgi:hypothetical protein
MFSWLVKLLYSTFYIEYQHSLDSISRTIINSMRYFVIILIKDNKYENSKIKKWYRQVRF